MSLKKAQVLQTEMGKILLIVVKYLILKKTLLLVIDFAQKVRENNEGVL